MSAARLPYLRRAMLLRGWTISELSARSGVNRDTLGAAASGKTVSEKTLVRIVKALDLAPVSPAMIEIGARLAEEAPAQVGGPGV